MAYNQRRLTPRLHAETALQNRLLFASLCLLAYLKPNSYVALARRYVSLRAPLLKAYRHNKGASDRQAWLRVLGLRRSRRARRGMWHAGRPRHPFRVGGANLVCWLITLGEPGCPGTRSCAGARQRHQLPGITTAPQWQPNPASRWPRRYPSIAKF